MKKGEFKYSFPPLDITTYFLCNKLTAYSSGTTKRKAIGKVEVHLLSRQWKVPTH